MMKKAGSKIRNMERKVAASIVCKKANLMAKVDKGSVEPIVIVAILILAIALVIFAKSPLQNLITTLSGKAETNISNGFK